VRRLELGLRGVDLGLRRLQRLIVIGAGCPALLKQRVLAVEMVLRLSESGLRRGMSRLR
jgi:hypothetical protein